MLPLVWFLLEILRDFLISLLTFEVRNIFPFSVPGLVYEL